VVNGSLHALGSDKDAIETAISQTHKNGALTLPVGLSLADGRVLVSVPDGRPAQSPTLASAEVWICGLLKSATVAIGRGENRGKTITYHNVARRWIKLGTWGGESETWSLPVHDFDDDGVEELAVLVQGGTADKPSSIYGAAVTAIHSALAN
jgi:hypothetical protein